MIALVVICEFCVLQSRLAAMTLEQLAETMHAHKDQLLRYPGGVLVTGILSADIDPTKDFGYQNELKFVIAWKWPKLYVEGSGVSSPDGYLDTRRSVYNFETNETLAYRVDSASSVRIDVHIVPHRHMFSSGFAFLFKGLHFAEGLQQFRYGDRNAGLQSVPECFLSGEYRVIGEERIGGMACTHVSGRGDDIWVAVDRGGLIHRRDLQFAESAVLSQQTEIVEYRSLGSGLWLPKVMTTAHYFTPDDLDRRNQIRIRERLEVRDVKMGNVDDELVDLAIPEGSRVTDLIRNETYFKGRSFDDVVPTPRSWQSILFLLNSLAVVILLVFICRRKLTSFRKRKQSENDA